MQIQNNSNNTAPMTSPPPSPLTKPDSSFSDILDTSNKKNTNEPETAKTTTALGSKDQNLSEDMIEQLNDAKKATSSNSTSDVYNSPLSAGERNHMEEIANDPAYAARQAELLGTSMELVLAFKEFPSAANGYSEAQRNAILAKNKVDMLVMKEVQAQRSEYYHELKDQGLPPAEIYAKLLEFNAKLPESHDSTLGFSEAGSQIKYSDYYKTKLDFLQQAIDELNYDA